MQVILLERIRALGQMGDVVTVKDGYARNFLLPQGKALRANDGNIKSFEAKKAQLEATNLETKEIASINAEIEKSRAEAKKRIKAREQARKGARAEPQQDEF